MEKFSPFIQTLPCDSFSVVKSSATAVFIPNHSIPVTPDRIFLLAGAFHSFKLLKCFIVCVILLVGSAGRVCGATYYTYQTGNWNNPNTWTTDPGGTTLDGPAVPANGDIIQILSGRTVTLTANVTQTGLSISINGGGIIDMSTFTFATLASLSGQGVLKLSSASFPAVTANTFVTTGGGTVEYNTGISLTAATQTTYNNLTINTSGTVIQAGNLSLNGNLLVKQGTFQINDNTPNIRQLTVNGNVTVNSGASVTVGTGVTNTTTDPTAVAVGGTPPFINYYDTQSHRVVISGDFTNNGTVRFTNLTYPVYNTFPSTTVGTTTGMATVYFRGSSNNVLTCNGITDFYNLVVDKGSDITFVLTLTSTQYNYFRLFGANTAPADISGTTNANPNIKKALWLRNGTLDLKGLVVIPSLTEGATSAWPTSDFIIPSNAALVVDGTEVIVLATADDYGEVNTAYGVSGGTGLVNGTTIGGNSGIAVLGLLQINNGYLSTRESNGLTYWSYGSGQLIMNNGTLDTKQIDDASGSNTGQFSYFQVGGTVNLRGRFQHHLAYASISDLVNTNLNTARVANGINAIDGTFHLNSNVGSGFAMGAGTLNIYDVCGTTATSYAFYSNCPIANIDVTGGTLQIIPTTGSNFADANYLINSTTSFGNLIVNNASGTSLVQLNTNPLNVLQNINIQSGILDAQNLNITVGANFNVGAGGVYNSGTNTTTFNGNNNQIFTIDGSINNGSAGLKNLVVKNTGYTVSLAGAQASLTVQGNFDLTSGTFADGGKNVFIAGNVTNSGTHTGSGKIQLNGTATQTIGGSGTGVFQNIELNNTNAAASPVSLTANATINGNLTFSQDKLFNIGIYGLVLNSGASIVGGSNVRYIQTAGNSGDGGLTKVYATTTAFVFPVGSVSASHTATPVYAPATIGFTSAPTTYGSITVVPVGYELPATTVNGQSLTYFWHVSSSGFSGIAPNSVTHTFVYDQSDVAGTEANYIPSLYNRTLHSWNNGTAGNINTVTNTISDWTGSTNILDADYTAGDNTTGGGAFGTPKVYYSLATGLWSDNATWTFSPTHTGAQAGSVPGMNDIAIIGNNHTVSLTNGTYGLNTSSVKCASLRIDAGATLDIENNPGSVFNRVENSPLGNGLFRLTATTAPSVSSPQVFSFPSNSDFTDFNNNHGTTEFYDSDGTQGALYILPANVTTYGNLMVTAKGGDNLVLPNNVLTTIKGDLTCGGDNSSAWIAVSWNTNIWPYYSGIYDPTVEKTVHITGNLNVNTGTLIYMPEIVPQHLVIDGNVTVGANGYIDVEPATTGTPAGAPQANTMAIGGNLTNNSNGGSFVRLLNSGYYCNLIFQGNTDATISGTSPTTIFNNVTVNKGNSQATTLTLNIGGTLSTPTDNWLTLQNGTFQYNRTDPGADFTISTVTPFTIPATAGLTVNMPGNANNVNVLIANSAVSTNDLYLYGKLNVGNGNVYVGPTNGTTANNNDIEYSSGGASAIKVDGGNLVVNGAIRRNPTNDAGVLSYIQTGGAVTINGQAALTSNAKLEVLNTGSVFNMSGGTITIVRGGGDVTFGDLYLRPAASSVTGGTINFTQSPAIGPVVDLDQSYLLDANVPLYNLTISGKTAATARNAQVNLMESPLVLNGNLTLSNANSILNAVNSTNNINLTINGNLINNGTYIYGINNTTFNGGVQTISGTSITNFYDLLVNPVTSLTLSNQLTINDNLTLNSGTLYYGSGTTDAYTISLLGNIVNNATYTTSSTYTGSLTTGGIILNGTTGQQYIGGNGTFGRLELNNASGAILQNSITLEKNLKLTNGIINLSQYLLIMGVNSNIEPTAFNDTRMIISDGVFSNIGVEKFFKTGASTFTYPMGTRGKYTPAVLTITANESVGFVRVNNISAHHPAILDPTNVLQYYWDVESSNLSGFTGNLLLNYIASDVRGTESNYVAAELPVPGTNWIKAPTGSGTDNVNETNHTIYFKYTSGTRNITGQYTAGAFAAIPATIPQYTSNQTGNWSDNTIWTQINGTNFPCPVGGPNGFIVTIRTSDVVTANADSCSAYKTTINGTLKVVSPYINHNFGTVNGTGTLYMESGGLPAGNYTSFFDCDTGGTLEFGGTGTYTVLAGYLFLRLPYLFFTGTGTRVLPNNDIIICIQLKIDGPTVDNSVYNKKLTILGTMERYNTGVFICGTGSGAMVSFAGSSAQVMGGALGDFSGSNSFNNFEINNVSGLTLSGTAEVKGNLLLTAGNITTTSSIMTISNLSTNCVTPAGGSAASFVSGPLTKTIIQGDNFVFPVGKGDNLGNLLTLSASQPGTQNWTVEYFNPNSYLTVLSPLTEVTSKEYWNVASVSGNQAIVNIKWIPSSDLTPLMTSNGLSGMNVAQYDTINSYWVQQASTQTGDNYNGSAQTTSKITIPATGNYDYTLACTGTPKPRVRFSPTGSVCGTSGIPVTLSGSASGPYSISYTKGGVAQTPVAPLSFPYTLTTDALGGVYQITGFTYNGGAAGVLDTTSVTVYAVPTTAIAGPDQSLCGVSSATLAGNTPTTGTGQWSIVSGAGGTVTNPTIATSTFTGTNSSAYKLRWTISNGSCTSSDYVNIIFPILAAQPSGFTDSTTVVSQGTTGVLYAVPNDPTATSYNWSYSGSGATIIGTTDSVTVNYSNTATSGTLSVTVTNNCSTSSALTISITVTPNIWVGTSLSNGTDWNTPANWQNGMVPPSGADIAFATTPLNDLVLDGERTIGNLTNASSNRLFIPSGKCLTINGAIDTNNDPTKIYIQSSPSVPNGTLIFTTTSLVYATVEMYSQASKGTGVTVDGTTYYYSWQFFGIPVHSIANASPTFDVSYVRAYNEDSTGQYKKWAQLNNLSPLNSFLGYEITQVNPATIVFQGVLENSNKTITLTNTPGAYDPGQNIISNSFTAAIDIRQLIFGANTEQTIYLFNTGSFAQWYNSSGGPYTDPSLTLPGQYLAIPKNNAGTGTYPHNIPYDIPSMSGFLVRDTIPGANGSITINYNSSVITQNVNPQRAPSEVKQASDKVYMEITLKGKRTGDCMWLINQPGTTHGFDNGWDGYKLSGTLGTPQLFAWEDSGNYQVSTSSDMSNTYLGFQAGLDLEDTLTFYSENLLTQYTGIYLDDLVANKVIDISTSGTQYAFETDSTYAPVKRFLIVTNPTEVGPVASTQLKVFNSGNIVFIQNPGKLNGEMIVYDMMGRDIRRATFGPYGVTAIQLETISGAYIIKAATDNERVTRKIVF